MEEHFNENYMESENFRPGFLRKINEKIDFLERRNLHNISTGWEISNSARNAKSLY
jgi:hypothetical protein